MKYTKDNINLLRNWKITPATKLHKAIVIIYELAESNISVSNQIIYLRQILIALTKEDLLSKISSFRSVYRYFYQALDFYEEINKSKQIARIINKIKELKNVDDK